MHRGYIKLYRKIRDNPRLHDPDYLALWIWLLIEANHKDQYEILGGKTILCRPGQFTTGRKQLCKLSGIERSKLERLLKIMENEHQIEQQTTNTNRLITITNWTEYQQSEQQSEQQVSNNRATSEQQVSTLEEVKNVKNIKNSGNKKQFEPPTVEEVKAYFLNNGYPANIAEKFHKGYSEAGWMDSRGNPVRSWKQKAVHVWFKPEDRQVQPIKSHESLLSGVTR